MQVYERRVPSVASIKITVISPWSLICPLDSRVFDWARVSTPRSSVLLPARCSPHRAGEPLLKYILPCRLTSRSSLRCSCSGCVFRAKELRAVDDRPLGRLCSQLLGNRTPNAIEIRRSKWRKIA